MKAIKRNSKVRVQGLFAMLATLLALARIVHPSAMVGQEKSAKMAASSDHHGEVIFRLNCADCHGLDARGGGHGPNLTASRLIRTGSDAALTRVITQGVPGTAMPANDLTEQEIRMVIAYIRSLTGGAQNSVHGNPTRGKEIFNGKGNCTSCHMVNGQGGRLGPDLSMAGSSRSIEFLTDSIRDPSKDLTEGLGQLNRQFESPAIYETVTVVTSDGRRIVGVPKNEDNFSLQMIDVNQDLQLFMKSDLKEVIHERKSLMPAYDEQALSKIELQDLLTYLQGLRPTAAPSPAPTKPTPPRAAEK